MPATSATTRRFVAWAARRRRDERGAIALVTALLMVVLVGISAVTVDIGTQRVARRDVQALADAVALDLSRLLDGRSAADVTAGTQTTKLVSLATALNNSVARNAASVVGNRADLKVTPYLVVLSPTGGYATTPAGLPVAATGSTVPNGVVVVVSTTVGFGFGKIFGISRGGVSRSSVGTTQQSACFDLGSYAAAVDGGNSSVISSLNGLLGLNLGLVSYQGLSLAQVSLAQLVATGQVGTIDQLLAGSATLGRLEAAALTALRNNGGSTASISALNALINATASIAGTSAQVGKLVSLSSGDAAALDSQVSVLDLIAGSIAASNNQHALDLSSLNVAGITGGLYAVQGTQRACGAVNSTAARATASQIAGSLNVPLSFPTGASVLGLSVTGGAAVSGGVGNAKGALVAPPAISCNAGTTVSPDTYRVDVNGGLLGFGVQASVMIDGTVSTGLLNGLVDKLLGAVVSVKFDHVVVSLGSTAPGTSATTQHADLTVPGNAINSTPRGRAFPTGSAYGGLGTVSNITTATAISGTITVRTGGLPALGIGAKTTTVSLGYGPIGSLVSTLLGTVNGVVNTTLNTGVVAPLNALLPPLATLLGLNAGGADVFSEYRPTCNGAELIG